MGSYRQLPVFQHVETTHTRLFLPWLLFHGFILRFTAALQPAGVSLQLGPHFGGTEHSCSVPLWDTNTYMSHNHTQTHTHHLRYFTHCRLHHSDILITICLIACMIFSPLWAHIHHNQLLVFCIKIRSMTEEQNLSSVWHRVTPSDALCFYWRKHIISHSDQVSQPAHRLTWLFLRCHSRLCYVVFAGHLKNVHRIHIHDIQVSYTGCVKRNCTDLTENCSLL